MLELTAEYWPKIITKGSVIVEIDSIASNRNGALICQFFYSNAQTQETFLTIDLKGYFEIPLNTPPLNLEIAGNILTEAADPANIQVWEYVWNPITKKLRGRVNA